MPDMTAMSLLVSLHLASLSIIFEKQWPNGRMGLTRLLKRMHGVQIKCKVKDAP